LLPLFSHAGSLYLCSTYSGGNFWSQAHCNKNNSLIERIVSAPDSLPFELQVKMAEQQRQGEGHAIPRRAMFDAP
jgi:hypothetical protein